MLANKCEAQAEQQKGNRRCRCRGATASICVTALLLTKPSRPCCIKLGRVECDTMGLCQVITFFCFLNFFYQPDSVRRDRTWWRSWRATSGMWTARRGPPLNIQFTEKHSPACRATRMGTFVIRQRMAQIKCSLERLLCLPTLHFWTHHTHLTSGECAAAQEVYFLMAVC